MGNVANPALGRTDADGTHGPVKRRLPDDFALQAETLTRLQLQAHYGASQKIVARWVKEADVTPVTDPNFRNAGRARSAIQTGMRLPRYLTSVVDRPRREMGAAGDAAEYLRRFGPVYRCSELGRVDPKGSHWRRGCAVLTNAEIIDRARRNGWDADAWRRVA